MVIYLERGADLHTAQLMPLPLTVSCSCKIQIGSTFLVPAHLGSPGQRAVKRVCVCYCNSRYTFVRCWSRAARDPIHFVSSHWLATDTTTKLAAKFSTRAFQRGCSHFNSWPTFSPYLYNRVWSELMCCNSLSHSRLACSRLNAHIQPSVNNPRQQTRPIHGHELS